MRKETVTSSVEVNGKRTKLRVERLMDDAGNLVKETRIFEDNGVAKDDTELKDLEIEHEESLKELERADLRAKRFMKRMFRRLNSMFKRFFTRT